MKASTQFKPLYTSLGTDEIITNFINERFSTTIKGEKGKCVSKKKNKRITEAKVYAVIHKFWVDRLHAKASMTVLSRNKLADDILGDKRHETSLILWFM